MTSYNLYKGFQRVGEYASILEAKKNAPIKPNTYNNK